MKKIRQDISEERIVGLVVTPELRKMLAGRAMVETDNEFQLVVYEIRSDRRRGVPALYARREVLPKRSL